ncbi:MAG: energy transducer TonB [Winogradskyella sp.]|uniref:energy transducer TonB n=1 Tax=Winogradskyella sp. TaxID=1883156 RepID=UPI0025EA9FA5|nr:energy transducer TonB [Winogradskyella sp.]NRB83191.1 energy transducer TonB [Winogradskyella sp.]
MKYFETKHQRNSARITALIALILFLLLFFMGPQYLDPPDEYGVAVNFGNTDFGSGNRPLSQPRQAVEEKVVDDPQPVTSKSEPTKTTTKTEEVMTEENAEAIAIKKQKEAEAKAKAEAERIEREKRKAEERERREKAEKAKKLDDLIGGVKNSNGNDDGGEGIDSQGGNKGDLDGNPYAPYNGIPGAGEGGIGVGLNGRGKATFKKEEGCENEYGTIIVQIVVNREGRVIEATPGVRGSNNITACLKDVAKKIALSYKWPPDSKAPARQYGKVRINFTPN